MDIQTERAQAEQALHSAELAMKQQSADEAAFREAKSARQAALEALERLEWAEKRQAELKAEEAMRAQAAQLAAAQTAAAEAKRSAAKIVEALDDIVEDLLERTYLLKQAQTVVNRGMHHESFGVRDGFLQRPTITAGVGVSTELAIQTMQAARDLARLASIDIRLVEQKASQRSI